MFAPGKLNSWICHCIQIIHERQYELNEMQGLTLCLRLRCSMYKSMLPLGMFHVQALCSACTWDVPCTSPCYHLLGCAGLVLLASPSAFLTQRMVDQIRESTLLLYRRTDTYKVIRVCRMCTRSRSAAMLC